MRSILRSLAFLLCAGLATWSCGDATSPTSKDVVGRYEIVSVNGSSLPFDGGDGLTLVSSVMVLGSDGSYNETISYVAEGKSIVRKYSGIFSTDGRRVVIETSTGQGFNLDVPNKTTLVENDENGIVVYFKR